MSERETVTPSMLEDYIDAQGIGCTLDVLATICREKAEHLQSNWQDEHLAKLWNKTADIIDRAAAKVFKLP